MVGKLPMSREAIEARRLPFSFESLERLEKGGKLMEKRVEDAVRKVFGEMDSGNFCGCHEGDLRERYAKGVEEFVEKLGAALPYDPRIRQFEELLARVEFTLENARRPHSTSINMEYLRNILDAILHAEEKRC